MTTTPAARASSVPHAIASFLLAAVSLLASIPAPARAQNQPVFRDVGDSARGWTTFAAEGVDISMSVEPDGGDGKPAIRLEYNFRLGSGYAGIRRAVGTPLPANYQLTFDLKSDLPENNLETKLVSPDGLDVWWVNRRAMQFPREWTTLTSRARHFEFAWGPSAGAPLKNLGTVEIVIASAEGGKGTLWLRNIEMRELPPRRASTSPDITFTTSSAQRELNRAVALHDDPQALPTFGPWMPGPGDAVPEIRVHLVHPPEIGGLRLDWTPQHHPASVDIETSIDGASWTPLRTIPGTSASTQWVRLGELEVPWLRLKIRGAGESGAAGLERLSLIPVEAGATPTAFYSHVAARSPRGRFPRGFIGEQSYWTIIGVPDGMDEALVSEDGAVEIGRKGFSLEPMVRVGDRLVTWDTGRTSQSLERGYLPIPTISRYTSDLKLDITAMADGDAGRSEVAVRYRITNTSDARVDGTLQIALRPFQVNPPTQWLNLPGGAASVRTLRWQGSTVWVNESERTPRTVTFAPGWSSRRVSTGDAGECAATDGGWPLPDGELLTDVQSAASALIEYGFSLLPGESKEWWVSAPLDGDESAGATASTPVQDGSARLERCAQTWAQRLGAVKIHLPAAQQRVADTALSTLAYILINKDGPGIQPGSRSYERSWIRDGSLTSAAMLAFGETDEVRRFIEWFAPRQFESGAVPCVVDRRGPDPVPEHDSHGQLIWLIWNYYQFTGDLEFLRAQFPHIRRAAEHIQSLRAQRLTDRWQASAPPLAEPGKPPVPASAFRGLVPASISHEGYSSKPMHSYWDDVFCLRGLHDAASAAAAVGEDSLAKTFAGWASDYAQSLDASALAAAKAHGISYMPGCVELGDFDPTSTTVALWPCDIVSPALAPLVAQTFERNWASFLQRRDQAPAQWKDYTPYELRQVGSYVLLGEPQKAAEVLDFHMNYRRPGAWNQWAEVVRPDARTPGFIGDMPHTWCGSDFLNSLRTMFCYDRAADGARVVLAGISRAWIDTGEPIGVENLRVPGGLLTASVQRVGNRIVITVEGTFPVPPGGVRVPLPQGCSDRGVMIDQKPASAALGEVRLVRLPATIELVCDGETGAPR